MTIYKTDFVTQEPLPINLSKIRKLSSLIKLLSGIALGRLILLSQKKITKQKLSERWQDKLAFVDEFQSLSMKDQQAYLKHHQAFLNLKAYEGPISLFNLKYERHAILTPDQCFLDTLEIKPKRYEGIPPRTTVIINVLPNNMHASEIVHEMEEDAEKLNAVVIAFNYRGVGRSTGMASCKEDLVTDCRAAVQRLLDQGVLPRDIVLKGMSLGGAVATVVAKIYSEQGIFLRIFNDRSFSNLTNVVVAHLRTFGSTKLKETAVGKIIGVLVKPLVKAVLNQTNWEMEAGEAFLSLENTYKDYIFIVPCDKNPKGDEVILDYASLARSIRTHQKRAARSSNTHSHEMHSLLTRQKSHVAARDELQNKEGKKANEYFLKFVLATSIEDTVDLSSRSYSPTLSLYQDKNCSQPSSPFLCRSPSPTSQPNSPRFSFGQKIFQPNSPKLFSPQDTASPPNSPRLFSSQKPVPILDTPKIVRLHIRKAKSNIQPPISGQDQAALNRF